MPTNGKKKAGGGPTGVSTRPASPSATLMQSADIREALSQPVPAEWQKEDGFREAEQPAAIGAVLVRELHSHIRSARIGYLFREKMSERDKTPLAKASKVSGKLQFYSDLDFLVEVNWQRWHLMPREQRVALIDHELCHFSIEYSEKGEEQYVMLGHDVEEFTAIVQRWGAWKTDLERFFKATLKQGELFASSSLVQQQPTSPAVVQ